MKNSMILIIIVGAISVSAIIVQTWISISDKAESEKETTEARAIAEKTSKQVELQNETIDSYELLSMANKRK